MAFNRYFDPAQCESDQKDLIISQLKADLFELRQTEKEYNQLKASLSNLESRHSLLQDEKHLKARTEADQRQRLDLNARNIASLRSDADQLRGEIANLNRNIQDLQNENMSLHSLADSKQAEIQKQKSDLTNALEYGRRLNEEIRALDAAISKAQLEKNRLLDENDLSNQRAGDLVQDIDQLEATINQLLKEKMQLENEQRSLTDNNNMLNYEIQKKNEEIKTLEIRIDQLTKEIASLENQIRNIEQQIDRAKLESNQNANLQANEQLKNKDLMNKIQLNEQQLRSREDQLNQEQKQNMDNKQESNELKEDNKIFNDEIEKHLMVVSELTEINRNLTIEVETHIEEDDRARQILNRRDRMQNIIMVNETQVKQSSTTILHISPKLPSFMK